MIPRVGRWIENTEQAFHSLAERGREWPSLEEIALQVRVEAHNRRRSRRSRTVNSIVDLIGLGGRPVKPSPKSRFQTAVALEDMKIEGSVESRLFDDQGELLRKDNGLGDELAPRYHMIPQPEASEAPAHHTETSDGP